MPFTDPSGYEKDHFQRVYDYIIKPACEKANFVPYKANDDNKTNVIILEIIKQIIDSDIVLCDLSSKNPNVLYELGIRQAFNKKVVLIKDTKTDRIFDIQGLRTIEYCDSLRTDKVGVSVDDISKSLKSTYEATNEVNSLMQLLSIKPAEITSSIEITNDTKLILDILKDLPKRITNIEVRKEFSNITDRVTPDLLTQTSDIILPTGEKAIIGDILYMGKIKIGKLSDIHDNEILFYNNDSGKFTVFQRDNINQLSLHPTQ